MTRRATARLTALLLGVAAALVTVVGAPAPATAAGCTTSTGVTVVVDFNSLGGGVQSKCVADGGGARAWDLFEASGFPLTPVGQFPGAVCRVSGLPDDNNCGPMPPGSAFWSLWDAGSGSTTWKFSQLGAASLKIPDGGAVAFSWDDQPDNQPPSYTLTARGTGAGDGGSGSGSGNGSGSGSGNGSGDGGAGKGDRGDDASPGTPGESPSETDGAGPGAGEKSERAKKNGKNGAGAKAERGTKDGKADRRGAQRGEEPSEEPSDDVVTLADAENTSASVPASEGGLPGWVPPALLVVLMAVLGGVLWLRRRAAS